MSSSAAGKFQDHYEVLGLDPRADEEEIREAYAILSKQHAQDPEKWESLSLALEVLTDPDLRRSFNKLKGIEEQAEVTFDTTFFDSLSRGSGLRMAVLCVLYDRRRNHIYAPSLSTRQLEATLRTDSEELGFALWYLKQRNLVKNDDKSSLQITVAGIDVVDQERPVPERILPFIRGAQLPPPPPVVKPAPSSTAASIIGMLRRGAPEPAPI